MKSRKGSSPLTLFFGILIVVVAIIAIVHISKDPSDEGGISQKITYTKFPRHHSNDKEKLDVNKSPYKRKDQSSSLRNQHRYPIFEHQRPDLERQRPDLKRQRHDLEHQLPVLEHQHPDLKHQRHDLEHQRPVLEHQHPGLEFQRQHPVLEFQRRTSFDTVPANYGDPIRASNMIASPYPSNYRSMNGRSNEYAYNVGCGPHPGALIGVPVQQGVMKLSSEKDGLPFHYQNKPLLSYNFFKPYGPNQPSMQKEIVYADTPFYNKPTEILQGPGLNFGEISGHVPFISSADSFAPFPEVLSSWEKIGIIQTVNPNNNAIMNIYRRAIAPLQDLFEYTVQDKDGFVVPLKERYLEDGDIIESVPGRESLGKWKFNDYVRYKYIWM